MTPIKLFQQISSLLDKLEIPYMLTGCCASNYYGRPRATVDIDFVIAANPAQIAEFLKLLPVSEYAYDEASTLIAAQAESAFTVINRSSGWKIDFLLHKPSVFNDERLRRRTQVEVEGICLFFETAEDLLLSQLQWTKQGESWRQIEDAAGILKVSGDELDRTYLEGWVNRLGLAEQWAAARKAAAI